MSDFDGLTEYKSTTQQVITIANDSLQTFIIIAISAPLVPSRRTDYTQNDIENDHRESKTE
jgi:hypothetical protein